MRLGILETGVMLPALEAVHGSFPDMFRAMLAPHLPDASFESYLIVDGHFPDSSTACDGWVITGSRFGVYDPEPWMEPLKQFIRDAADAGHPVLGICFGHQIAAEAMGGRAIKSPKGWGAGIHDYHIDIDGQPVVWPMLVSHQDQVVELPPDAKAIGGSDHCPLGVIAYDKPILTAQFHPEFDPALSADLVRVRAGLTIPESVAANALESLHTPPENHAAAAWMAGWLRAHMPG